MRPRETAVVYGYGPGSGYHIFAPTKCWQRGSCRYSGNTRCAYARDLADYATGSPPDHHRSVRRHADGDRGVCSPLEEQRGLSKSTVARRLTTLERLLRLRRRRGLISRSPIDRVRRPKYQHESPRFGLDLDRAPIPPGGRRKLTPRPCAVPLLAMNALRISEALGAKVEDMGQTRGHCTLQIHGKGAKMALMPLAPTTCEAIDIMLGARTTGPLFQTDMERARVARCWTWVRRSSAVAASWTSWAAMRRSDR